MAIQRWELEQRWVFAVQACTGVARKSDTGRYVLFTDHERETQGRYSWPQIEAAIRAVNDVAGDMEFVGAFLKDIRARLDAQPQEQAPTQDAQGDVVKEMEKEYRGTISKSGGMTAAHAVANAARDAEWERAIQQQWVADHSHGYGQFIVDVKNRIAARAPQTEKEATNGKDNGE